jgi:hypothetical protein
LKLARISSSSHSGKHGQLLHVGVIYENKLIGTENKKIEQLHQKIAYYLS